jgi:hypothetical protein
MLPQIRHKLHGTQSPETPGSVILSLSFHYLNQATDRQELFSELIGIVHYLLFVFGAHAKQRYRLSSIRIASISTVKDAPSSIHFGSLE